MWCAVIVMYPPTQTFSVGNIEVTILIPFFALLFLSILGITLFYFHTMKHGIIIGSLLIVYLIFQINNLTHPLFAILLFALLIALELLFSSTKKTPEKSVE